MCSSVFLPCMRKRGPRCGGWWRIDRRCGGLCTRKPFQRGPSVFLASARMWSSLLQAFDAFVLPSRKEGLSIATLEAQAAGLPSVVSEGVPEEAVVVALSRAPGFGSSQVPAQMSADTLTALQGRMLPRMAAFRARGMLKLRGILWNLPEKYCAHGANICIRELNSGGHRCLAWQNCLKTAWYASLRRTPLPYGFQGSLSSFGVSVVQFSYCQYAASYLFGLYRTCLRSTSAGCPIRLLPPLQGHAALASAAVVRGQLRVVSRVVRTIRDSGVTHKVSFGSPWKSASLYSLPTCAHLERD